jgi:phosphotransferase system enzyme I (PtsI)
MSILKGKPVSPGYVEGTAVVYDYEVHPRLEIPRYAIPQAEIDDQHKRLEEAVERSRTELERAGEAAPRDASDISQLHARLVQEIASRVREYVSREEVNVEQAVDEVVKELAQRLGGLENAYFREREQDVRDVGQRMLGHLAGDRSRAAAPLPFGSIIAARELLPSEALEFAHSGLAGIVTELGSDTSHTAIVARSLGIPAVVGISEVTAHIRPGMHLLVDGVSGAVTLAPTEAEMQRFRERKHQHDRVQATVADLGARAGVTRDGLKVTLLANIERPDEVETGLRASFRGCGVVQDGVPFPRSAAAAELCGSGGNL